MQGRAPACKDACGTQREECLRRGKGEGTLRPAAVMSGDREAHVGLVPGSVQGTSVQEPGCTGRAREGDGGAQKPRPGCGRVRGNADCGGETHCAKSNRGPGAPLAGGGGSVVLLRLLPSGHPEFLAAAGPVPLRLPDPHRLVLGHDPVVAGPLEEVALGGEGRGSGGCRGSVGRSRDPRGGGEQRKQQPGAP